MQSKTSFFNAKLFSVCIKRNWPLWAFASLVALFPTIIMLVQEGDGAYVSKADVADFYYSFLGTGVPLISFFYAIIVAMVVWNYLYTQKSVNFFHSVPVRRESLFVTQWLAGMFMLLIPYVIGGVAMSILLATYGVFNFVPTISLAAGVIGETIFFFGFASLLAQCTGNVLALPFLYLIVNFIFVVSEMLVVFVSSLFYRGMTFYYNGITEFLSPLVFILRHSFASIESVEGDIVYSEPVFNGGLIIVIYSVVGVLLTLGAVCLYRIRKSETAGDTISFKVLKNIIHIALTIIGGLGGGLLLAVIFTAFDTEDITGMMYSICVIIAGTISYYVLAMLIESTIKVFTKKKLPGYIGCMLAFVLYCTLGLCDVFGVEEYVPDINDIKTASFYTMGYNFMANEGETEAIARIIESHKGFTTNLDELDAEYAERVVLYNGDRENEYTDEYIVASGNWVNASVRFDYVLKNGRSVSRVYNMIFDPNVIYEDGSYESSFWNLTNSKEFLNGVLFYNSDYKVYAIRAYSYYSEAGIEEDSYGEITDDNKDIIYNAILKDIDEGNWHPLFSNYFVGNKYGEDEYGYINLDVEYANDYYSQGRKYSNYDYREVSVTSDMTNTVNALRETGVVSESLLEKIISCR